MPVWAIAIASAANSFSFFMLLSCLPTYLVRSEQCCLPHRSAHDAQHTHCLVSTTSALSLSHPRLPAYSSFCTARTLVLQHDVFGFRLQSAGLSSAAPYFALMLTTLASSALVDVVRQRKVSD